MCGVLIGQLFMTGGFKHFFKIDPKKDAGFSSEHISQEISTTSKVRLILLLEIQTHTCAA